MLVVRYVLLLIRVLLIEILHRVERVIMNEI